MFDWCYNWCCALQLGSSRSQLEADRFHLLFLDYHIAKRGFDLGAADGYGAEYASLLGDLVCRSLETAGLNSLTGQSGLDWM